MKLHEARAEAERLIAKIALTCDRLAIAGSVRREKPNVKDIELVCSPRFESPPGRTNLFGELYPPENLLWAKIAELVNKGALEYADYLDKNGRVTQRKGDKYRGVKFPLSPIKIEIFTVPRLEDWGVNFMIRTGSADFSHGVMTYLMHSPYRVYGGQLWLAGEILPCPEEEDFFAQVGIQWLEPQSRRGEADVQRCEVGND